MTVVLFCQREADAVVGSVSKAIPSFFGRGKARCGFASRSKTLYIPSVRRNHGAHHFAGNTRSRLFRQYLVLTAGLCTACSSGLGAAGGYLVTSDGVPSAGFKTRTMVSLAVADGPNDFAIGLDTELAERLDEPITKIGQWRIAGVVGYSNMPKPNESIFGSEMLLNIGMARKYIEEEPALKFLLGGQIGIPIRLFCSKPSWRSDDFVSLGTYLVPYIGADWYALEDMGLIGGISIRLHLWSSTLP